MVIIFLLFITLIIVVVNVFYLSSLKDKKMEYLFQQLKELDKKWEEINKNEQLSLNDKLNGFDKIYHEYKKIIKECDNHINLKK